MKKQAFIGIVMLNLFQHLTHEANPNGSQLAQNPKRVRDDGKRYAFTMAEILLSLTIIGVVAAITLPSLTGNINERTWNTQRKALYARMSQAIALMPSLNGYGTATGIGTSSEVDTAAETFVASGLSKVLKINNICDNSHLQDCGFNSTLTNFTGSNVNLPKKLSNLQTQITNTSGIQIANTSAVAFETANGESVLTFYNPNCYAKDMLIEGTNSDGGLKGYVIKQYICASFLYDLNGAKGMVA